MIIMKKKIAVLFPGIGYTCDKPLLYYTGKLAVARGYKLVKVEYGNFPSGIKENKEKMEKAIRAEKLKKEVIDVTLPAKKNCVGHRHPNTIALEEVERVFTGMGYEVVEGPEIEYDEILFVSKSIGTVISSAFARRHQLSAKNILFTPLQQTFLFADGNGIVFHGTADPWADTKDITEGCKKLNLPLILTDEGNHSLETGDTLKDLENLQQIIGLLFNSLDK